MHLHHRPGHHRLHRSRHCRHAIANRPRRFRLRADHEARLIDEVHHGQVEGVGEFNRAPPFLRALRRHGTSEMTAVICQHQHRLTCEAREAGDLARAVVAGHFEEAAFVEHGVENVAHIEGFVSVSRDNADQALFATFGVIAGGAAWCQFPHTARQVRKKTSDLLQCIELILRQVIDHTAAGMHGGATEFVLGHAQVQRPFDQRWPTDQHLRSVSRHHCEMRCDQPTCGKSSDRPERSGRHGYLAQRIGDDFESRLVVNRFTYRPTGLRAAAAHAATSPFQQAHQRHAVLHS